MGSLKVDPDLLPPQDLTPRQKSQTCIRKIDKSKMKVTKRTCRGQLMKTQTKQQTGKIGEVTQLQQACIRKIEESCHKTNTKKEN